MTVAPPHPALSAADRPRICRDAQALVADAAAAAAAPAHRRALAWAVLMSERGRRCDQLRMIGATRAALYPATASPAARREAAPASGGAS